MPRISLTIAVLLAAAAGAGCSKAEPASPPAAMQPSHATAPAQDGRRRLIFFMNPNGAPCQMQDEILRAMPDLTARVDVIYYRTTEPADIARFEQYGVRSLPQLLVTDASGATLRRATPGIQSDPQVRQLIAP